MASDAALRSRIAVIEAVSVLARPTWVMEEHEIVREALAAALEVAA